MYRTLLSDYDTRQRELVLENTELGKVLQQMKKDMVSILSSRKSARKGNKHEHGNVQDGQVISPSLYSPQIPSNNTDQPQH